MKYLLRQPFFWLTCFGLWCTTLFTLSAFSGPSTELPPIVNIDKVAHFGFFFGGSGLLSAYLFRRAPSQPDWRKQLFLLIGIFAVIGALDEFHQSFIPGRSGNDVYDWIADLSGSLAGAFVFKRLHHLLK